MPINTVDLISSAFEDASFAAISTACERWAQAEGITLIAHDWRGSQSAPEEACDGRRPVVLHVPHGFRRFDGGLRDFRLHPSSVRVFERPVAEPWRIEGFGDLHLIHGRGLKSFKWALRMLAKSTASPVLHLRYGRHPDQVVRIQQPIRSGAPRGHPIVILLHGGFWSDAVSVDHMVPLARSLCDEGFMSVNVEFRRGQDFAWEQSTRDVFDALIQLNESLSFHNGDVSRITMVGHSSGAHIAHSALSIYGNALRQKGMHVTSLVSLAGILDLESAMQSETMNAITHDALHRAGATASAQAWNPMHQSVDADVLAVHGDGDQVVPFLQSDRYVTHSVNRRSEMFRASNVDHMDLIKPSSPLWDHIIEWMSAPRRGGGPVAEKERS